MKIQHNLSALNSNRMVGITTKKINKSSEKLSSGFKINRAADDAAGLAISEKMRRQIRGLTRASLNCQDGISLCQIADGALNEVHDILNRCTELAVQAANGTNTEVDRGYIQKEIDALTAEINRIQGNTTFNEQRIFSANGMMPDIKANNTDVKILVNSTGSYQVNTGSGITVSLSLIDAEQNKIGNPEETKAVGIVNSEDMINSSMAEFVQKAAANAVSLFASKYPKLMASASTNDIQIGLQFKNIDGQSGTLATASLSLLSNNENAVMSYSMSIDISDY